MRTIPNLGALQMFEAAARHQSFTRASEELFVTQSAVCRQVAGLERDLDVKLFSRVKKRIVLNQQGQEYASRVRQVLEKLGRDTQDLVAQGGLSHTVELAVTPTFGAEWLIPRLPAFQQLHRDVTVHMSVRNAPFLFSETHFDAAISFGESVWAGTTGSLLRAEGEIVPVCSPALAKRARMRSPANVLEQPLLHLASQSDQWQNWCASQGLTESSRALRGQRFGQFSWVVGAAVAGLGVALVARFLVERQLARGELVVPVEAAMAGKRGYFIVYPADSAPSAPLRLLSGWLESTLKKEAARHKAGAIPAGSQKRSAALHSSSRQRP